MEKGIGLENLVYGILGHQVIVLNNGIINLLSDVIKTLFFQPTAATCEQVYNTF